MSFHDLLDEKYTCKIGFQMGLGPDSDLKVANMIAIVKELFRLGAISEENYTQLLLRYATFYGMTVTPLEDGES